MLVFVVAKNTSPLLRIVSGEAFRAGCAIAGAEAWLKPNSLSILYGPTTKVVPLYTKPKLSIQSSFSCSNTIRFVPEL
jgi:hypothetical protein